MKVDMHAIKLVERRAAYPILLKYKVNRYELWMLCQMAAYLKSKKKVITGQTAFFDNVTGNHREKKKMSGYYFGLVTKKLVGSFEYVGRPGSECFGISDFGLRVLAEYDKQVADLVAKLIKDNDVELQPFETGSTGGYNYYRKTA